MPTKKKIPPKKIKETSPLRYSSETMRRYFNDPEFRHSLLVQGRDFMREYRYYFYGALLLFVVGIILYFNYIFSGLPSLEQLENPKPELATKVYSLDGEVLESFYFKNRTHISFDKIPPHLIEALIATEDKHFYEHWGVTPWRFLRAMIKNIFSLRLKEGASTITQQLARNLYNLQSSRENAFDKMTRKIREYITSVQIERNFTKKEILEMYFNVSYFGRSAYGISAASSIYFDKPATDLTLGEATLLVGMLKGPGYYDPLKHPARTYARREVVLSQMVKDGKLTQEEAAEAEQGKIEFHTADAEGSAGIAPHFSEFIRRQLLEKSEKYGFDIYKDGLVVYTTLDSRMQRHANRAVEEHLAEKQAMFDSQWNWDQNLNILAKALDKSAREYPSYLRAGTHTERDSILKALKTNKAFIDSVKKVEQSIEVGLIAIDPHTGGIRAMVGGRNFRSFKYGLNHTTQIRRQPGSAFKAFLYTAAIDNGYPPTYQILNQPIVVEMPDGTRWTPGNFEGEVGGKFTLREALTESINLVAVRMIMELAPPSQVVEYAKRMGIKSPIPPYQSIALGTAGVTPLEITSAYGVFANEGVYVEPVGILKIEDKDGTVIEENIPEKKEVLSKETSYIMTSMMQDVVDRGTGARVRNFFHYPAAGKTGTTQDFADAWYIGYTPQLSVGIWVGFDDQQVSFPTADGQGGRAAAPLWGRFMQYVYSDNTIPLSVEYFRQPNGVVRDSICADTKKLATEFCPVKETEVFNTKYLPPRCDKHTSAGVKEEGSPIQF